MNKNFFKKLKQCFMENRDILVVGIFIFLCDIYIKYQCNMGIGKLSMVYDSLYICVLSIIIIFFPSKIKSIIEICISIVMSIVSFSQVMHYKFFSTFYRIKKFKVIGELYDVMDEVVMRIDISSLIIFIFMIVTIVVILFLNNKDKEVIHKKTFIFVEIFLMMVFFTITRFNSSYDDSFLKNTFYNNAKYINRFGICDYLANDVMSLFNSKTNLSDEKEQEIIEFIKKNNYYKTNEYTSLFKDKNLILIECESLNNYPFNEELTPTLTKLSKEGYYFTNFYSPLYGSATSDAEFISLTSMLPSISEGQTCYTYPNNNYKYSLPNLFTNIGYDVNSYHSNYASFYNRNVFHKALGFNEFYDLEKLGIKQLENYEEDINWIPDTLLFNSILDHTNTNTKFFDFVTTVSGHMPYVDYREEIKGDLSIINSSNKYNYMKDETKAYVACQMCLDKGLKILLDKLQDKEILDETIIILFGDHYPYGLVDDDAQYTVYGTGIEKYKTPLIIYDPTNTEGKTIDTLVSSFDIYPSICNLFGLNSSGGYKIGKDVFEEKHIVPFADRSILTEDYYYDSTMNRVEWYGKEDDALLEKDKQVINEIFDNGELILVYDFYNK